MASEQSLGLPDRADRQAENEDVDGEDQDQERGRDHGCLHERFGLTDMCLFPRPETESAPGRVVHAVPGRAHGEITWWMNCGRVRRARGERRRERSDEKRQASVWDWSGGQWHGRNADSKPIQRQGALKRPPFVRFSSAGGYGLLRRARAVHVGFLLGVRRKPPSRWQSEAALEGGNIDSVFEERKHEELTTDQARLSRGEGRIGAG